MQQFRLIARSVFVLCGSLMVAAASFAQLPDPQSVAVTFYGDALANAESKLVSRGIDLDGMPQSARRPAARKSLVVPSACGAANAEIVWREVRRESDPQGGLHVFYRQFAVGGGLDAELAGSEIGVHSTAEGKVIGIGGRQFDSVTVSGCPTYNAAQAADFARDRVLIWKGEYAQHGRQPFSFDAVRAERLAQTKLKLVQIDGSFRPAWFTVGDDAEGEPYSVVLDAENENLLSIRGANPHANCDPTTPLNLVSASGVPVRPELTNWRGLGANTATRTGTEGFTHEGVWMPSLPLLDQPLIRHIVYHGTTSSTYRCAIGKNYTVFPLKIDTALNCCQPVYENNGTWGGRAAGDALYNTWHTMRSFRAMGRKGWDNLNGDARIVVNSGNSEQGQWITSTSSAAPLESVRIGSALRMYNLAASLDLVAHEWGHGMITKGANFDYNTQVGAELHEGWADVIGMLVEKRAQASGTGLEQSSDWVMHEDAAASGYARGAVDDDADGVAGHEWVGINSVYNPSTGTYTDRYTFDDRLHRLDGVANSIQPHATGNMLNVAYLIMAAGGSTTLPNGLNPVCARMPWADGCESSNAVTGYLGSSNAGSLLFHAIQFTVTGSTTWNDVADRVVEAAFQRFNNCSAGTIYNAPGAQDAVRKAFKGIGFPSSYTTAIPCP